MQAECNQNLNQLSLLLEKLTVEQYNYPSVFLSGASIGQHIRHILEFYICLREVVNLQLSEINYDKRKRDRSIEQNPEIALQAIQGLIKFLEAEKFTGKAFLITNFSIEEDHQHIIPSSFGRELAYCLEHSIHHQALIKISLVEQELGDLVGANFGVAPSTTKSQLVKIIKK